MRLSATIMLKTRYFVVALALFSVPVFAAELLIIEETHCPYCKRFNAEIAPAYPHTEEGKQAPLVRLQLGETLPEAYASIKPASFTPTFILVENGQEVDRILGYPGDEYFWFLLNEMLDKIR